MCTLGVFVRSDNKFVSHPRNLHRRVVLNTVLQLYRLYELPGLIVDYDLCTKMAMQGMRPTLKRLKVSVHQY